MKSTDSYVHYIASKAGEDQYPLLLTTIGYQTIAPGQHYPPEGEHPDGYFFQKGYGRTLPEYQLVFIKEGRGTFRSTNCPQRPVSAGDIIILHPGEWHWYMPDKETGWTEYWVGFKSIDNDNFLSNLPFSLSHPVVHMQFQTEILSLYDNLIQISRHELDGFHYISAGIIAHIIGYIAYAMTNRKISNQFTISTMDKARALMRTYVGKNISPEQIAGELGVGYSWFRQTFREVVGVSPAQYQQQLRLMRAEFLLTNPAISVADIAFELGFANANQFSTFFKLHKHTTPLAYRKTLNR